jgi:predicted transcriptional regulator
VPATETADPVALTADIVSAFVARNSLPSSDLPGLIATVHAALVGIASGAAAPVALTPTTTVSRSITAEYLICLDDGRKFKALRRHLALLGKTPDEYRTKWNLPTDHPMVAANYAAVRSALAKKIGLGHLRRGAAVDESKSAAKGYPDRLRKTTV